MAPGADSPVRNPTNRPSATRQERSPESPRRRAELFGGQPSLPPHCSLLGDEGFTRQSTMRYYSACRCGVQAGPEEDPAMERSGVLRVTQRPDGQVGGDAPGSTNVRTPQARRWFARSAMALVFALSLALLVNCGGNGEDSDGGDQV